MLVSCPGGPCNRVHASAPFPCGDKLLFARSAAVLCLTCFDAVTCRLPAVFEFGRKAHCVSAQQCASVSNSVERASIQTIANVSILCECQHQALSQMCKCPEHANHT
jgi:hypothetical protein